MNEEYKEYKKIAFRFLKESGLYPSFIEYIKSKRDIETKNNWFKKDCIDMVFGHTRFTGFLEEKGIYPGYRITKMFRSYVNKKYPGKYKFGNPNNFIKEDEYNNINLDTDIITIGYEKK